MGRTYNVFDAVEGAVGKISNKDRILSEIIRRVGWIEQGCTFSYHLLRYASEPTVIPSKRPSGSPRTYNTGCVGLDSNFSAPIPSLESFKLPRGTRMHKLAGLAIDLFEDVNKKGQEIMAYCQSLEEKIKKNFGAKATDDPTVILSQEERADYVRLAIFICERQLGINVNGLGDPVPGPERQSGLTFSTINHGSYLVWEGESHNVEARLAFIDALIEDKGPAEEFSTWLKSLQPVAHNLNLGKNGLQFEYNKLDDDAGQNVEIDPTKLCYSSLCHSVYFGGEEWAFHTNGAYVVRALIDAYSKGMKDVHINDIRAAIPSANVASLPFSQLFKSSKKDAGWKKLIKENRKGFWCINPAFLENGVKEIKLGLPGSIPPKR